MLLRPLDQLETKRKCEEFHDRPGLRRSDCSREYRELFLLYFGEASQYILDRILGLKFEI